MDSLNAMWGYLFGITPSSIMTRSTEPPQIVQNGEGSTIKNVVHPRQPASQQQQSRDEDEDRGDEVSSLKTQAKEDTYQAVELEWSTSDTHKERERGKCNDVEVEREKSNDQEKYADTDVNGTKGNQIEQSELPPVCSNVVECHKLKMEYDNCFQRWFANDFLHGFSSNSMEPCQELFDKYSACVNNGLKAQQFVMFQPCPYHSTDPDDHRVEKPREKSPSGAGHLKE